MTLSLSLSLCLSIFSFSNTFNIRLPKGWWMAVRRDEAKQSALRLQMVHTIPIDSILWLLTPTYWFILSVFVYVCVCVCVCFGNVFSIYYYHAYSQRERGDLQIHGKISLPRCLSLSHSLFLCRVSSVRFPSEWIWLIDFVWWYPYCRAQMHAQTLWRKLNYLINSVIWK